MPRSVIRPYQVTLKIHPNNKKTCYFSWKLSLIFYFLANPVTRPYSKWFKFNKINLNSNSSVHLRMFKRKTRALLLLLEKTSWNLPRWILIVVIFIYICAANFNYVCFNYKGIVTEGYKLYSLIWTIFLTATCIVYYVRAL